MTGMRFPRKPNFDVRYLFQKLPEHGPWLPKALTVHQPWAWAILHAGKDIENRRWPARYTGRLYIHASKTYDVTAARFLTQLGIVVPDDLPMGAIVGAVSLVDGHHSVACMRGAYGDLHPDGLYNCSRWAMGPNSHHWRMSDRRPIAEPVPERGYQRLWTPRAVTVLEVERQLTAALTGTAPTGGTC